MSADYETLGLSKVDFGHNGALSYPDRVDEQNIINRNMALIDEFASHVATIATVIGSGLSIVSDVLSNTLTIGLSGGQTIIGGTAAVENLYLQSTGHSVRGRIECLDPLRVNGLAQLSDPDDDVAAIEAIQGLNNAAGALDIYSAVGSTQGEFLMRVFEQGHFPGPSGSPSLYINAGAGLYTRKFVVISGVFSGTGQNSRIIHPSTTPFMLGIWADVAEAYVSRVFNDDGGSHFQLLDRHGVQVWHTTELGHTSIGGNFEPAAVLDILGPNIANGVNGIPTIRLTRGINGNVIDIVSDPTIGTTPGNMIMFRTPNSGLWGANGIAGYMDSSANLALRTWICVSSAVTDSTPLNGINFRISMPDTLDVAGVTQGTAQFMIGAWSDGGRTGYAFFARSNTNGAALYVGADRDANQVWRVEELGDMSFRPLSSDSESLAGFGKLYSKDLGSGVSGLYWRDSTGAIRRIDA